MSGPAVAVQGLRKRFGETEALAGIDLEVRRGTVCGLLGPNGAGKTTAVRILATLLRADGGTAEVAGLDVQTQAAKVRARIGLVGQSTAVDELLTGRQNLVTFGRLHHLSAKRARERADELLERFDLTDAAGKRAKHYSGGMRRRLDLAAGLILSPDVLFLDEPTTGLDPRNRNEVWAGVRSLVAGGTTVLLTTQYLDEADQLAGQIVVIDRGRVIADGTPAALKASVGGDRVDVVVRDEADLARAATVVGSVTGAEPQVDRDLRRVSAPAERRVGTLTQVAVALERAGVDADDVGLRRPTLDDAFLGLTGHGIEAGEDVREEAA